MLAREQGWYEADDRIDAALPFLNRDLGWDDRAWGATAHGFQLLLDRYVEAGRRACSRSAPRRAGRRSTSCRSAASTSPATSSSTR